VRYEALLIGIIVLGFGIFLVSSHGYVGSTYLPGLIGLPASTSEENASFFPGVGGYSVGTIVAISGLGLLASGIRSPSRASARPTSGSSGVMPPAMAAALQPAMAGTPIPLVAPGGRAPGPGPQPGIIYCAKCGRGNPADARFCQQCGAPAPPSG